MTYTRSPFRLSMVVFPLVVVGVVIAIAWVIESVIPLDYRGVAARIERLIVIFLLAWMMRNSRRRQLEILTRLDDNSSFIKASLSERELEVREARDKTAELAKELARKTADQNALLVKKIDAGTEAANHAAQKLDHVNKHIANLDQRLIDLTPPAVDLPKKAQKIDRQLDEIQQTGDESNEILKTTIATKTVATKKRTRAK